MEVYAVVHRQRKSRKGKGFSRGELKEVGLSLKQALKLGIQIDPRRSTKHGENVKTLKTYLSKEEPTPETLVGLTEVKGISQKRFEQLKAIGIDSVKKLAESDPKEIAEKLGVSEKASSRWIENAKNILTKE
jgi:transcriptional regulator with XRE-family HTH domain